MSEIVKSQGKGGYVVVGKECVIAKRSQQYKKALDKIVLFKGCIATGDLVGGYTCLTSMGYSINYTCSVYILICICNAIIKVREMLLE